MPNRVVVLDSVRTRGLKRRYLQMADYYGTEARAARAVRAKVRGTQDSFARLLGIPAGTVRNWERGRRKPTGTARVLLQLIEAEPEIVGGLLRRIQRAALERSAAPRGGQPATPAAP
jgi:DNA-binding transcriptional regulator YiaG